MYDYDYLMSFFLGTFAVIGVIAVIFVILETIGLWKVFKKAGRKGWESLIPFYNTWVLGEISGVAAWWPVIIIASGLEDFFDLGIFESLLSLASLFASFIIYYNLSKKFHKDSLTAVLFLFFRSIMFMVAGLSNDYQYDANVSVSQNGPFGGDSDNSSANNQATNNMTVSSVSENVNSNSNIENKKYCSFCGVEVNPNSKFCPNCGSEIK